MMVVEEEERMLPHGVMRAVEGWIYISMSGYTLDSGVHDLSIHDQQHIQANPFT